jgi:hypothetical protein
MKGLMMVSPTASSATARLGWSFAVAIVSLLTFAASAGAVVLTLGAPTDHGAGVDSDAVAALYASGPGNRPVLIARVGGIAPDGSVFSDLGVPSISPDGVVVFGAETRGQDNVPRWNIYRAVPGTHQLEAAFDDSAVSDGCRPLMKFDPYPVAGHGNVIGFLAPEASGGDAVFRYEGGRLSCVARTGDRTAQGDIVKTLGFGTAQMAPGGEIVMLARVAGPDGTREEKSAVAFAAADSTIHEVAVEGQPAPGGGRFTRYFGQPAIVGSQFGPVVAFSNRDRSGAAVYQSSRGHLSRSFGTGMRTDIGTLSYISDGHPGLIDDGTIVVRGACGPVSALFMAKDGELSLVAREGDRTRFGTHLASFTDPYATATGGVLVSGHDDAGVPRLFTFPAQIRSVAHARSGHGGVSAMPSLFPGSVAADQRGDYAFLGAPPEADGVRTAQ